MLMLYGEDGSGIGNGKRERDLKIKGMGSEKAIVFTEAGEKNGKTGYFLR